MITTVLIANRGEIALRIARTCREMGLRTVAVHSTVDADTPVVRVADESVCIGPPEAQRSYLYMAALLEAARVTGADAVHPGYGFLSESADFARACEEEGLVFVGPGSGVLERLGDKATARKVMADNGIPVLPGSERAVESPAHAREAAERIGYPLLVKAVAGGGGRGIRLVREPSEIETGYTATRALARDLFDDDRVYLERWVPDARHVEVQILGDSHGNIVHLGERDCSVQRRRQKLVEESPAPALNRSVTDRMAEAAIRGAKSVGYVNAGTFEFLVAPDGEFHFTEVNCRLQVEHPVTEAVTGIDLVREQLLIAAGHRLGFGQHDLEHRGSAIECRINAEDPRRGFVPTPGRLTGFVPPGGPFTRVDTHGYAGYVIPPDYDPLIAKVITWGPDRSAALARMRRALAEFEVEGPGVHTTTGFLTRVLTQERFVAGEHTTSLVDDMHRTDRAEEGSWHSDPAPEAHEDESSSRA